MKREVVFLFILLPILLLILPTLFASSLDAEIQKITHYAEEYEIGNINYVQLLVYMSSVKEKLNEILGATEKEYGGILKQDQIKAILGEPQEETKWVWIEAEEYEKKLDYYVPVWRKIVFDGKKIQIRLDAYPSIFKKGWWDEEGKFHGEGEEFLIYRLHFGIEFKRPQEQLDINSKINEIKTLAEIFNSDPSKQNAENLAKQSVNAERAFESFFKQNPGKCENLMTSIFGSEYQRDAQKIIAQQIVFYEGENFEAIMRLEMCDDCEWNWINVNMWLEGRGPGFKPPEQKGDGGTVGLRETYKDMTTSALKAQAEELLLDIKGFLEEGNYNQALNYVNRLMILNEVWNEKANDVWEQVEEKGETVEEQLEIKKAIQEAEEKDPYYWIKREQQNRQKARELRQANYHERKEFYLNFFSSYEKKEFYFEQKEWEKRLVQEFKERGEEICDNHIDDNDNEQIDCQDDQCGGRVCGRGTALITEGNQTKEAEVDLYCILGTCQAKQEINETTKPVCGNHKCEPDENLENCARDCTTCPKHPPLECPGKVIFKGKDENGCPLEPICIEEEETCEIDGNCVQPLCGKAKCIEGKCKTTELLSECKESECVDGDEEIKICDSGEEIIADICIRGLWVKTKATCEIEKPPEEEMTCERYCKGFPAPACIEAELKISGTYPDCDCNWVCGKPIVGEECIIREDCGGENDVCSNGKCVAIPEKKHEEPEIPETEIPEEEFKSEKELEIEEQPEIPLEPEPEEELQEEVVEEETPVTGGFFRLFMNLANVIAGKITGAITGFQTQENESPSEPSSGISSECPDPGLPPEVGEGCWYEQRYDEHGCVSGYDVKCGEGKGEEDWEEREEEERKRHEEEQKERCEFECNRPCVEKCTREACGEEMDCNVDEEIKKCENTCSPDEYCIEKCMTGEEGWWREFQEEPKMEKGVFQVGGSCRTQQGREEGFIWFGGWGEPFEQIQPLKNKYYQGGQADWCKYDLENLKKQRAEFEKSFNEQFVKWFFEKYLANSAEDWEQSVSGIFELYWRDVDLSREMVYRMDCLDIKELPEFNLINIKYETSYGSLEFWEEIKEVRLPEIDKPVKIISPYMKIWIFPPKEFIKYEMKQSMIKHEFPGSPEKKMERKNEEGPTAEEREMIKQNEKFMKEIREISGKYDGNVQIAGQFLDYETNEVVFNVYVQINENDIIKIQPMLPEEVPEKDITVEIDFEKIYDLIYTSEKEMRGTHLESPPWDKKLRPIEKIKEATNGIKMFFKIRDIISSAKVYPESSKKDVKALAKIFVIGYGKKVSKE